MVETFNTFPEAQWVWWLDLDAMIMNPEIDLNSHLLSHVGLKSKIAEHEEFLLGGGGHSGHFMSSSVDPASIDIIVAQDHNGLNAGSFFLRRSKFTQLLLDFWSDPFF